MSKLFTFEEVAQHNKREDLWMIIDKKVYDITAFVDESAPVKVVSANAGGGDSSDHPQGNPLRIIIPLVFILGYIYYRFYA
ncbi:hypothetical protein [Absidia glauca]|uniref:Cytochrome b5 heme-binding domain-containing protein n=1 Tax=Absidia glauca TaxID=4829 RepID=A0A168MYT5_ABSGL|nr:hypothetical protein [Absidia glauca]